MARDAQRRLPRRRCCRRLTLPPPILQVTTAVREIAPAEYDAALRAAPAACPLLAVAGDGRSGAELLAGLDADRRHAPLALRSAAWAAQLERLAADLRPKLARPAAAPPR